ncbi:zinc finger, CCHC-type containing protein [Tanacetum coccineum]
MGDENPIHTLGDYSRPSHTGYQNTIELPDGNNGASVIRHHLVGKGCACVYFNFPFRDQASNWLERLPARSISTCEDLTTYFLAQFFPSRWNAKLCNDILMFQQHQEPNEVFDIKKEVEDRTNDEPIRNVEEEITGDGIKELVEAPRSRHIGYYLKHEINEKLIKGLIDNQRYNDSLLATCLGKMNYETYNSLLVGPMYSAILKKKITKKEDIGGSFVIPCNVGGLKYMDALVDQGSDVNVMPLSINNRLTNEKPVGTNIRLSLASHSYIFPLGIAKDVLVEIAGKIRFDKGTITLKSGKNKINFFKIPESLYSVEEGTKSDIDPAAPTTTVIFDKKKPKSS